MKKVLLFVVFSVLTLSAQEIQTPKVILSGIPFNIKVTELNDTLSTQLLTIKNGNTQKDLWLIVNNGVIDTSISINFSGSVEFSLNNKSVSTTSIPGWLSILPPLIAILVALFFRQVIVALFSGIYLGALFIYNFEPLTALLRILDTFIVDTVTDKSHSSIIIFTLFFGALVGLISANGGTRGLANSIIKIAKTRRSGLIATWFMGILIFFDDYANTLIVGNLMRPITDKLKISREKLAFIVDSTSAPVASIMIVSSWIGFEVGLIHDGLVGINSSQNAYEVFLATIPFRFYPIAMLFFVFLSSWMRRDFGPMYKAELRAAKGEVISKNANLPEDLTESTVFESKIENPKWFNAVFPIVFLIVVTIIGLIVTGINGLKEQGINDYGLREIISNSDSYVALLWSSGGACIVAILMTVFQRLLSLNTTLDAFYKGFRSMLFAIMILVLAWQIGSVTEVLQTAHYIVFIISDSIDPRFLPVIVFIVCAITSFATGTSWGTMAIMMPIVIPLSNSLTGYHQYSDANTTLILYGVVSSVLAGSVFGDHCSPIADTTILSSMASSCDHIDHVRTQLPYSLTAAFVCMIFGDLLTAFGFPTWAAILIICLILFLILKFVGKSVDYVET